MRYSVYLLYWYKSTNTDTAGLLESVLVEVVKTHLKELYEPSRGAIYV